MTWHAPDSVLAGYAQGSADLDDVLASSVDQHLLGCARCRAVVAAAADPVATAASWDAVADRIDAPRPNPVEWVLRRLGVAATSARLVSATRSLRLSWLAAIAVVVAAAVAAALQADSAGPFLLLAPMVPLAGVTVAFAAGAEPAGEAALATPLAGVGLVLRRAVAVLASSLVLLAAGAVVLPGLAPTDAAWVLPALALSTAALALATWVRVEVAAGALVMAWLSVLVAAAAVDGPPTKVPDLAVFATAGQVAFAAVVVVALAVLVARRDSFSVLGRTA